MTVDNAHTLPTVLRVAVDAPLRHPLDYLPPAGTPAAAIPVGARVRVPLGGRRAVGIVVAHAPESALPPDALKCVQETLDREPLLDGDLMRLLAWTADYYHHPLGEVLAAALPTALRDGAAALPQLERWRLTQAGREGIASAPDRRAKRQSRFLALLSAHPEGLTAEAAAALEPAWRDSTRRLRARGWVDCELVDLPPANVEAEVADRPVHPRPTLSAEQIGAVASIEAAHSRFAAFLLHGATGSGKTEVYLQCAERALARGRTVLVLVPEIGLTPQLVGRFRERLRLPIAVLHSSLSDGERLSMWRAARHGVARVVLGTRSAVFAPLADLGLVVVDEEHDSSFKQQDSGCRYSARDVAVVRAQQRGVPIVLGSATPSFEALHNVASARYLGLALPRRADQSQAPRLTLVDLRAHAVQHGLSMPAREAMRRHLAASGQVLVFINRRGYAPTLLCTACGWIAPCGACDARLTVHRASSELRCHYCGAVETLPRHCPRCGFAVKPVGQGTERIEEYLRATFPAESLIRLDRDTAANAAALESIFESVLSGNSRIVVGTQMVTKGHHFPGISLVVVLNADQGLFSTDFRAAERLAQTIVQVAGRAGRESTRGEVLIQTEYPEHPLLQSLLEGGYEGFASAALAERAAARWPPFGRLALLRASSTSRHGALDFLAAARELAPSGHPVRVLGPVAAAMERRAARYYAQLLLESQERGSLHQFVSEWLPRVDGVARKCRVRYAIDVDALEIQ